MEVIVRNLDELADLMLVFFQRLIWLTPRLRTRFAAVLACLMCANVTQSSPITWAGAEPFADPKVVEPAPGQSSYPLGEGHWAIILMSRQKNVPIDAFRGTRPRAGSDQCFDS